MDLGGILVLGGLGFLFAVLLSIATQVFAVEVDEREEAIAEALPGANCGACGYPGCSGLAKAIANGEAPVNACNVGGAKSAEKISEIMGVEAGGMEKQVAVVKCQGDCEKAKDKFEYQGICDCRTEGFIQGGSKACLYGCLGCGTCVEKCNFGALSIKDGIAVVDKEKCVACGLCVQACPKKLIDLIPYKQKYTVKCNSHDKGRDVRSKCSTGCIGCQLCVKNCPKDAITFENNVAKIDTDKCVNCGICSRKCPTGAIFPKLEEKKKPKEA